MKLYYSPGACSMAAHIALNEMEFKYDLEKVNLKEKTEAFLKVNPKGSVPVMTFQDGETLTELAIILQYLSDTKPEKGFFPKLNDPKRYHAMEMLHFVSTEIHKGLGVFFKAEKLVPDEKAREEFIKANTELLNSKFNFAAEILGKNKFLLGDEYSIVDMYFFTVMNWTRMLGIDMKPWPKIMGLMETVRNRPAVQATLKAEGLLK